MDTLITSTSNPSISFLSPSFSKQSSGFSLNFNSCFIIRNGHSSFVPISSNNLLGSSRRRSLMVEAKKGNEKKKNKVNSHSFIPKPNETGVFPEAVLLKQKKVQEDGRALPEFADEEEKELYEFLHLRLQSDLDADQMRHYEVVYMIHQDHKDKVEEVNNKIQDFIKEKKGRVWRFSDWGMRRLAYKIQKATHAHYILMNFELGTKWINEFTQILEQDEKVIRHLVIKREKAITENCPPPPELYTLRADMVNEYDVDDMEEDEDEDDEEEYDDDEGDLEGDEDDEEEYDDDEGDLEDDEDDEIDVENVSSSQETASREPVAKGNSNTKREKVVS